ncbi:SubName: Full=Uncharacterized protein {ECO:0000313/EMBL:CCA74620.1} [Serendipita indica DSM 11827]|nr:SubName: Full=Uncharacterized protein {ECO:0000313/EMBL:CCA74620.1} [Serendipita indica DSM 11827]
MSYPPAAPQTYDHPFAYQLPTLTPAPADAAPAQQLPTPPTQSPEHRYAVAAPLHLQATPIHLGLRVIRIINLLDHIRLGIHMNAIPPGQPNGPPNTPRSPYNPRAHMPCPPTEERDFPTTGGHFQPQLELLANPDGSPPFTHFVLPLEPILQTSPARVQRARRRQTGQLASAHVPSSSAPLAKLDMNITGGSTTSQTSATCATGGAVSSKLGPLTPSTHHSRDPHDERVLELLSRVATGMTTPVATAPEQSMAGAGDGGTAGNLTDSND